MIEIIPLQNVGDILSNLPQLPSGKTIALVMIALIVGMSVPTAYGIERFQGFGRALISKLPYKPPPGMSKKEALKQAIMMERSPASDEENGDNGNN